MKRFLIVILFSVGFEMGALAIVRRQLYSLYPNLNAHQLQVCLLTKIEVKPKMVAEFVQLTEQGVGSLKRRLYEKTFKKKGGTKDFDQSILLI